MNRKLLITAALVSTGSMASFAQAPGWSRGQQNIAISYDECLRRAGAALRTETFRIDYSAGAFLVGIKDIHTAVIMCNPAPENRIWVNIVVASNGGGGGEQRQRLQALMDASGVSANREWAGDWEASDTGMSYGMVLYRSGSRITGTYAYRDGQLEGSVGDDNVLNLNWSQNDGRRGTARFVMSPDGQRFTGRFTVTYAPVGSPAGSQGDWNGVRKPKP
jgi:hypothetical protein